MEAGMSRLVQFDQLRNTRDLGGMVTMEGHRITEGWLNNNENV